MSDGEADILALLIFSKVEQTCHVPPVAIFHRAAYDKACAEIAAILKDVAKRASEKGQSA